MILQNLFAKIAKYQLGAAATLVTTDSFHDFELPKCPFWLDFLVFGRARHGGKEQKFGENKHTSAIC